jgi:hypothetical protein
MPLNHASDRVASPVGKVFTSHASSDEGFVDRLAYDLSRHGVSVWYDKLDLRIGDSIPGKINEGLSACVPRPGSRARGSAAWRPLRQSSARAPCCNDPVLHAATPRTRASATRCRAGRFSLGDAPAIPRHSRHVSREPLFHAARASAPAKTRRGRPRRPAQSADGAAGLDRLVAPAMQQGKQPAWARL